jgi:hypothetical protein
MVVPVLFGIFNFVIMAYAVILMQAEGSTLRDTRVEMSLGELAEVSDIYDVGDWSVFFRSLACEEVEAKAGDSII